MTVVEEFKQFSGEVIKNYRELIIKEPLIRPPREDLPPSGGGMKAAARFQW